jgi:hypothetical protein
VLRALLTLALDLKQKKVKTPAARKSLEWTILCEIAAFHARKKQHDKRTLTWLSLLNRVRPNKTLRLAN